MQADLLGGVDACHAAGVPILVVHLSSGIKPPSLTDIGRGRFITLVEHAAAKGVQIAFENQRKLANLAWTFEEFEDAPNVGFCWDTGHENCFSPGRQYMPLFGKKLICTHIHDNMGQTNGKLNDPDTHLLPFEGNVNYQRCIDKLDEYGYTGPLTLEVGNSRYQHLSPEEFLATCYERVKRIGELSKAPDPVEA